MLGSLTSSFRWSQWRGKRSRNSRHAQPAILRKDITGINNEWWSLIMPCDLLAIDWINIILLSVRKCKSVHKYIFRRHAYVCFDETRLWSSPIKCGPLRSTHKMLVFLPMWKIKKNYINESSIYVYVFLFLKYAFFGLKVPSFVICFQLSMTWDNCINSIYKQLSNIMD